MDFSRYTELFLDTVLIFLCCSAILQPLSPSTLTTAGAVQTEGYMQSRWAWWCRLVIIAHERLRKRITSQPGLHGTVSNKRKPAKSSISSTEDRPESPGDGVCRPGHYPGPGECQASPLSQSHICSPKDWRLTLRQMKLVSAFFFSHGFNYLPRKPPDQHASCQDH